LPNLSAATSEETAFSLLQQDLWHNKTRILLDWREVGSIHLLLLSLVSAPLEGCVLLTVSTIFLSPPAFAGKKGSWAFASSFLFLSLLLAQGHP
jgi:hypothetical protein